MLNNKRLVLAHFWLAFILFGVALLLGAWQMLVRSPLHPWVNNPEYYYRSVTAHGTVMAYVLPTLVAMGFAGDTRYRVVWDFCLALVASVAVLHLWSRLRGARAP